MVLAYRSIVKSQRQLNRVFKATPFGIPFSRIDRLGRFGVRVTVSSFGDEHSLIDALEKSIPPILFLQTLPLPHWENDTQHAVVVVGYRDDHFLIHDPAIQEPSKPVHINNLLLAWDGMSYAYALVE